MNGDFVMADNWYEPPPAYNWYCPDCFWSDESFFPIGKAYEYLPACCPDCGRDELLLNKE